MSMDIYLEPGEKVVYCNPDNGYEEDQQTAEEYLELDGVYTIEEIEIFDDESYVYFEEVPDIGFNTVLFEEADE